MSDDAAKASTKRNEIILAVWRVILLRGIAGVSFRAAADSANVSLGLVQHYFPTKEELIRAGARAMIDGSARRYEAERASPQEAVRHLVVHAIPTTDQARDGVVVWHAYLAASVTDDGLALLLRQAKAGQEQELAHLLREGRVDGDDTVIARALVAVADGLASRVMTGDLASEDAVDTALWLLDTLTGTRFLPPEDASRRGMPPRKESV